MGDTDADRTVFVAMVREEWRLHSRLFGGRRFAAFPGFVALVAAAAVGVLYLADADLAAVVFGLHVLLFAFGLYTGSVGLVGHDAMRNLLGDVTLVLFSARTLPLSRRRLLAVFLLKDAVYYACLFVVPLTVAFLPVALVVGWTTRLPFLWATATATFLQGLAVTVAAVGLASRGRPGRLAAAAGAVLVAVGGLLGVDLVALLPYALYRGDPLGLVGLASIPLLAGVGLAAYDPTYRRPARTAGDRFAAWNARLDDPLLTKTLLDVARSSGGFWKVLFSGGVLFAVSAFLFRVAEALTGLRPATGIAFGSILGLTGFTTYNWLTQFDDAGFYLAQPVSTAAVFRAKFRAFLVCGLPTALAYFLLAVALFGSSLAGVLTGVVVLAGLSLYLYGLVVFLAGLSPNEFLFDTVLFAGFTAAIAVPLVPILVVGFVGGAPSLPAFLALFVASAALGSVGVALYRRAIPRWEVRYRR